MLLSRTIKQVETYPKVVNPLSVLVNPKGKKRLSFELC